ncbi:hypothetical protein GCM10023225_19740 [Kineococcus glutinatus]|uniref:Uncharacterized protein n=1 Tax=Kineococcus glutinatus TaxID=1070872 RepID=A0ABP9HUY3_9ACTN
MVAVSSTAVLARRGWRGAVVGAAASAALFCYVDLLTVPPMSWALCAAVAGAVGFCAGHTWGSALRGVLAAGAAWPVAFGLTWVSRWVVAALAQGPSVFSRVAQIGRFRLDGQEGVAVSGAFGAGVRANWLYWTEAVVTAVPVVVAAGAVCAGALVVAVRRRGVRGLVVAAVLAVPALVVPAWYAVLSNHSQIHAFFTYRSLAAAVGVVVMACLVAARRPVPAGEPVSASAAGRRR